MALPQQQTTIARPLTDDNLSTALQASVFPGASVPSIRLVLDWCVARKKDPLKKPCHIVPMWDKAAKAMRDVIMPSIGDVRQDAMATGAYVGKDPAAFGDDVTEKVGDMMLTYPSWCEATVYGLVQGVRCPFPSGRVRFKETYATASRDTATPNAMWKKRPYGQLEKCAEAQALRRAFPDIITENTVEEMAGKVLNENIEVDTETGEIQTGATRVDAAKNTIKDKAKKKAAPAANEPIEGEAEHVPNESIEAIRADMQASTTLVELVGKMNKLDQDTRREVNEVFKTRMAELKAAN